MNKSLDKAYFNAAKDWSYEKTEMIEISRNRWFLAFCLSMLFCTGLIAAFICILPLKTFIPLVIHQNKQTGEVWIKKLDKEYVPENSAEVKADIVRYITTRESYSGADLNERFRLVMLLSTPFVAKAYANEQSNGNKTSPVNLLGANGQRTVHIEDIVFIDKESNETLRHFHTPSQNLAKVDFSITTIDANGIKSTTPWVATIGWVYQGIPNDEALAWDNWNGFTVTTYRLDPKNVESKESI